MSRGLERFSEGVCRRFLNVRVFIQIRSALGVFIRFLARFTGVIAFIDGLQQVREFSAEFVEDL